MGYDFRITWAFVEKCSCSSPLSSIALSHANRRTCDIEMGGILKILHQDESSRYLYFNINYVVRSEMVLITSIIGMGSK